MFYASNNSKVHKEYARLDARNGKFQVFFKVFFGSGRVGILCFLSAANSPRLIYLHRELLPMFRPAIKESRGYTSSTSFSHLKDTLFGKESWVCLACMQGVALQPAAMRRSSSPS